MSISIYYSAIRQLPLSTEERTTIETVVLLSPIETLIAVCGDDFNGEDFCIYQTTDHDIESGVLFEGATKLPSNSMESFWLAIQYWCKLLSEIRRVLPDANWNIHIDNCNIPWDNYLQSFDISTFDA